MTNKNCIVLGCAKCVWSDFDQAKVLFEKAGLTYEIMVINFAMLGLSQAHRDGLIKVTHWVALHRYYFSGRDFWAPGVATHSTRKEDKNVDYAWGPEVLNSGGSGGAYAAKLALHLGYRKVVLCGVPIDNGPRFYDYGPIVHHYGDNSCRLAWQNDIALGLLPSDRVRSMSGWTKERLGEVTAQWLKTS